MPLTNQELFLNWVEQVEKTGRCVKYRHTEDDQFVDCGTIWAEEFIEECRPSDIFEMNSEHFLFIGDNGTAEFYADEYPTDAFGQIGTFRNPPECFLMYMDKNVTDCPEFLLPLDSRLFDIFIECIDDFIDSVNNKYPNSISYVGEIDEEKGFFE